MRLSRWSGSLLSQFFFSEFFFMQFLALLRRWTPQTTEQHGKQPQTTTQRFAFFVAAWTATILAYNAVLTFFPAEATAQNAERKPSSKTATAKQASQIATQKARLPRKTPEITVTVASLRPDAPKLIVVMSFDQMRGDYPNRWGNLWSQKGFNRIIRFGAYFPQCYFNHASNITAPGHSVHLTGMYPWKTGIVSNDHYDRAARQKFYCVQDTVHTTFGMSRAEDHCSPVNLQVSTLGDYLKTISPKSRVIGISQKDRAAILMSGHLADAAYWFEFEAGGYTSSTYYFDQLPAYVRKWNEKNSAKEYSGKVWNTVIDDDFALPDTMRWEGNFGKLPITFPHVVSNLNTTATLNSYNNNFGLTPFAVEHFFKFVKTVFREEKLGQDDAPDLLCLSISSTDYLGHAYGPDSREMQELYVHIDKMLGDWIDFLDDAVERKNYTLVITSDHGVAPAPEYTRYKNPGAEAGRIHALDLIEAMEAYLRATFPVGAGSKWIDFYEVPSIFLNPATLELVSSTRYGASDSPPPTKTEILDSLAAFLLRYPGIGIALTSEQLEKNICPETVSPWQFALVRNDYFPQRTGDIVFYPSKFWITSSSITTTHGAPHDYDRHVPMMLMGAGVRPGYYRDARVAPSDIAPSLAQILGITLPNADGKVLPWK
jgi:predicted AlkP superfamily pyrophosphatase or phosphodiesterase